MKVKSLEVNLGANFVTPGAEYCTTFGQRKVRHPIAARTTV
jgi:hypothetical protein